MRIRVEVPARKTYHGGPTMRATEAALFEAMDAAHDRGLCLSTFIYQGVVNGDWVWVGTTSEEGVTDEAHRAH